MLKKFAHKYEYFKNKRFHIKFIYVVKLVITIYGNIL